MADEFTRAEPGASTASVPSEPGRRLGGVRGPLGGGWRVGVMRTPGPFFKRFGRFKIYLAYGLSTCTVSQLR